MAARAASKIGAGSWAAPVISGRPGRGAVAWTILRPVD